MRSRSVSDIIHMLNVYLAVHNLAVLSDANHFFPLHLMWLGAVLFLLEPHIRVVLPELYDGSHVGSLGQFLHLTSRLVTPFSDTLAIYDSEHLATGILYLRSHGHCRCMLAAGHD